MHVQEAFREGEFGVGTRGQLLHFEYLGRLPQLADLSCSLSKQGGNLDKHEHRNDDPNFVDSIAIKANCLLNVAVNVVAEYAGEKHQKTNQKDDEVLVVPHAQARV